MHFILPFWIVVRFAQNAVDKALMNAPILHKALTCVVFMLPFGGLKSLGFSSCLLKGLVDCFGSTGYVDGLEVRDALFRIRAHDGCSQAPKLSSD